MCRHSSDDLWAEFDEINQWYEAWFDKLKVADENLRKCKLDYHQILSDSSRWSDTTTIIDLYAKKTDAEVIVNELHKQRQEYIKNARL